MTMGSIIALTVVVLLVGGAILALIHGHRSGKCSCGCDGCCNKCNCSKCIEIKE
jgi:hypothetical protein